MSSLAKTSLLGAPLHQASPLPLHPLHHPSHPDPQASVAEGGRRLERAQKIGKGDFQSESCKVEAKLKNLQPVLREKIANKMEKSDPRETEQSD